MQKGRENTTFQTLVLSLFGKLKLLHYMQTENLVTGVNIQYSWQIGFRFFHDGY